eukprot:11819612-Alexandrium_andersonii.AAC.1
MRFTAALAGFSQSWAPPSGLGRSQVLPTTSTKYWKHRGGARGTLSEVTTANATSKARKQPFMRASNA